MVKFYFLFVYLLNDDKLCLLFKWDENINNFQDFYKMDKIYISIFLELVIRFLNFYYLDEFVVDIVVIDYLVHHLAHYFEVGFVPIAEQVLLCYPLMAFLC